MGSLGVHSYLLTYLATSGLQPPSGLLSGEREEVRRGKCSLHICDHQPLRAPLGNMVSFTHPWRPLKGQPFPAPSKSSPSPNIPSSHLLPPGESLCGQSGVFSASAPTRLLFPSFSSPTWVKRPSRPGPGSAFPLCSAPRIPPKPVSRTA